MYLERSERDLSIMTAFLSISVITLFATESTSVLNQSPLIGQDKDCWVLVLCLQKLLELKYDQKGYPGREAKKSVVLKIFIFYF